jgi:arylsulfatase A-like enzyme
MSRRHVLRLAGGVGACFLLGSVGWGCGKREQSAHESPELPAERPSFLFLLADDLGWGDLGCYGHPDVRTPNIDALAWEGTRFTQFYVSSPVCSPTRAAFLTGMQPGRLGLHGHLATFEQNAERGMPNCLDPGVPTLTRMLQQAGYATGHFGKWHLGGPQDPGAPEPGAYGINEHATVGSNGPQYFPEGAARADDSRLIADRAVGFLERHADGPFFLNVWFRDPHAPLAPTPEQLAVYRDFGAHGDFGAACPTPQQVYCAAVTEMDTQVGRLLAKLDDLGLTRSTVVVFASDNGPEHISVPEARHSGVGSAGPFRGGKRSLYEGGIRVPFIVRWPGVVPDYRIDNETVVADIDLLPTVCELAHARPPETARLDGQSTLAAWLGSRVVRRAPLMWEYRFEQTGPVSGRSPTLAIRQGRWKLLMNADRSRVELYDLLADPMETDNVASEHGRHVADLAGRLLGWRAELPGGPAHSAAGANDYRWPQGVHWLPGGG